LQRPSAIDFLRRAAAGLIASGLAGPEGFVIGLLAGVSPVLVENDGARYLAGGMQTATAGELTEWFRDSVEKLKGRNDEIAGYYHRAFSLALGDIQPSVLLVLPEDQRRDASGWFERSRRRLDSGRFRFNAKPEELSGLIVDNERAIEAARPLISRFLSILGSADKADQPILTLGQAVQSSRDAWEDVILSQVIAVLPGRLRDSIKDAPGDLVQVMGVEIRELASRIQKLERGGGRDSSIDALADDLEAYRASIRKRCKFLKLEQVLEGGRRDSIPISEAFVPQHIRPSSPPVDVVHRAFSTDQDFERYSSLEEEPERKKDWRAYLQSPKIPVGELLSDEARRQIVLLGDPGSGKSTLLMYWLWRWLSHPSDAVPLYLELKWYARSVGRHGSILEYLQNGTHAVHTFSSDLGRYLSTVPSVLLCDGLDEVFELEHRIGIEREIIRWRESFPLSRVVVTSRASEYSKESWEQAGFAHYTIQEFDESQVRKFVSAWYRRPGIPEAQASRLASRLLARSADFRIGELCQNPLLLTLLAMLNLRGELPVRRADLYRVASDLLLGDWDHRRGVRSSANDVGSALRQDLLTDIAEFMMGDPSLFRANRIPFVDALKVFCERLSGRFGEEAASRARELLAELRSRNFALRGTGVTSYGFVHRTFLEYFSARAIIRRSKRDPDEGRRSGIFEVQRIFFRHWNSNYWRGTLILLAGIAESSTVVNIVEWLLDLDDKETRRGRRALVLAGHVLNEHGVQVLDDAATTSAMASVRASTIDRLMGASSNALDPKSVHESSYFDAVSGLELIGELDRGSSRVIRWLRDRCLSDQNYALRRAAVVQMFRSGDSDSALQRLSVQILATDRNELVRVAVIDGLAKRHSAVEGREALFRDVCCMDSSRLVRGKALVELARLPEVSEGMADLLLERAKEDGSWSVRVRAITMLDEYREQSGVEESVVEVFESDHHVAVRLAALDLLARSRIRSGLVNRVLKGAALQDKSDRVRSRARLFMFAATA